MILFREDFDKYPGAIIDTKTTNTSFLRLSALYRDMGVINHTPILVLHNKELQGVDPFDPNLSTEQMIMIGIECKINFWYYIREIARVPGGTHDMPIKFSANRGNIALYWLFFNHITVMLIQPRQTGKSFSTDELMTYLLNIRCTDTELNLLTKDDTLRSANLERLKNIELELPFYLKQRGRGDVGNTEELSVKSLGNRYRGHLPNKSPKLAYNVGRGLTSPVFQLDEAAFFYNIAISLPAALAAGTAARNMAAMKNEPYGTIITTTAGKQDDRDGFYIYDMLMKSAVWTEKFFDARDRDELEILVRKNAPRGINDGPNKKGALRVNCTFSHRQLGYTDKWLRDAIEACNATGEDANRDFFNVWTAGSRSHPLPVVLLTLIRESQQVDYYDEISTYGYITRWFIPEQDINFRMNQGRFVMALDTSDAAGGDDIALIVRDVKTGATIAAGNYNETNLITFSEWIVQWLVRFSTITLIVERRSTGSSVLDYLLLMLPAKGIDPFARLYNKVIQEADEFPDRFNEINKPMYARSNDIYVKYKKYFGFATSATGATSRTELYGTLLPAAKMTGDKVRDPKTIDQILALTKKNGRVDHPSDGHDDLCIAWLLTYWLLIHGKHLSFYGIASRDILSDNKVNRELNDPALIYQQKEQEFYQAQIEYLSDKISKERDDFVAMRLEAQLKLIVTRLTDNNRQTLSIDELIANLREARKLNSRTQFRYR